MAMDGDRVMDSNKRRKLLGGDEYLELGKKIEFHECSRYVWWSSRQESVTKPDRKFVSRRLAMAYLAKRNSDELQASGAALGKTWSELTANLRGPYVITPNRPFDESFLELSDKVLEDYGADCGSAINMLKMPTGRVFTMFSHPVETTDATELLPILAEPWADSNEADEECRKAQAAKQKVVGKSPGGMRMLANGSFAE